MNSVEFLQKFHPGRAWVLTCIEASQKGITTKAFPAGDNQAADAEAWIKEWSGRRNIYFSVAEVMQAEDKKAERENIANVHWLHVDIDAQQGDLLSELQRIKTLCTTKLPTGVPKPTVVIYSGGGYQCFWRLAEPIPVQGSTDVANEVARYNKQLEIIFGGDSCSDVSRIMRLPGTQNIPSARKIQKGRVQVEAKIQSFTKKSHALTDFSMAAEVGKDANVNGIEISGNVPRLATVDDLDQWSVVDRVKVIIVNGNDPDTPKDGDSSRSAWLFDCVCQLVRHHVPDDVIYSVITDPGFPIAASVLEANNPDRYAKKQIVSAKEAVESEWLHKLNTRFAVIGNIGGKCRVIEEVHDGILDRHRLVKQSFGDFKNRFLNQFEMVPSGKKGNLRPEAVGQWWLKHPRRREFDRLVFEPGRDIEGAYNLWRGYHYNALPGNNHESYLDHIKYVICKGNETHYEYLIKWMARTVQKPAQPGHTAVVMRGRQGTGKGFFAENFGRLFGRHFLHVSNANHLAGQFNSHLRDAIVVFGDESFHAGNRDHESSLKTLITERTINIEAKGVDAEVCPNYTHLIMASNSDWVVPVGPSDRRFFVLDVSEEHMQDREFFGKIAHDLENSGFENLLHYLLNLDLAGFNVEKIPMSIARQTQVNSTMSSHEEWWLRCLEEGRLGGEVWEDAETRVFNYLLWDAYLEYMNKLGEKPLNETKLGLLLSRVLPEGWPKKACAREDGTVKRARDFPAISDAREEWCRIMRVEMEWEDVSLVDEGDLPF
ncbi:MAG: hypothetical protein GY906_28500 [bacterium]|nr:hypothetical protein [bacterium]